MDSASQRVPVFGISRLRVGVDGPGVTTLVCFMGCTLRCRYCLNDFCHRSVYMEDGVTLRAGVSLFSPQELFEKIRLDNIYFQATGGGVCFGGGEPGLQWEFIREFRRICGPRWRITIETSLRFGDEALSALVGVVDYWIVDIKSMDEEIYRRYTGFQTEIPKRLEQLKHTVDPSKVMVRVPQIPGYTTDEDIARSVAEIRDRYGFTDIDQCRYVIREAVPSGKD